MPPYRGLRGNLWSAGIESGSLRSAIIRSEPYELAPIFSPSNGVDEMVLSLYAKGLTAGEISAHFAEIYGRRAASCSRTSRRPT